MSHADGQVHFGDGLVLHYQYDGISDVVNTRLFPDWHAMKDTARGADQSRRCRCGGAEPVRIATDYGGGFTWDGTACRSCLAVVSGVMPFSGGASIAHGLPTWWRHP